MAQGHDGFLALKGNKYLIDDEQGQLMSGIVRKYLLGESIDDCMLVKSECSKPFTGSRFVKKMARLAAPPSSLLQTSTQDLISREVSRKARDAAVPNTALNQLRQVAKRALRWSRSKTRYQDYINVSGREHMSNVDCFDGQSARIGAAGQVELGDDDLLTIHPIVDGRLKNIGRNE